MTSIHFKLDYSESVSAKKEILLSEKSMLEIIKHMRTYSSLRKLEFTLKSKIKTNLSIIGKEMALIEAKFPEEEVEAAKKKFHIKEEKREVLVRPIEKKEMKKSDIEDQLEEIKRKLSMLQ